MSAPASAIATAPRPSGPYAATAAREVQLSRVLMAFVIAGLFFMLMPGTFFGVWNLIVISRDRLPGSVSAAWVQAHGHAQIFGWIGSFILGIGYHSIPKLRRMKPFGLWAPWATWCLWVAGVTLRWAAGVYEWQWRALLPLSAVLELAAFLIFLVTISGHRSDQNAHAKLDRWILLVIAGCIGWAGSLVINLVMAGLLSWQGVSPALPHSFDQRLLVLQTWGFLVPFIWGFSAKWLPVFLGLKRTRARLLLWALFWNSTGVVAALTGWMRFSAVALTTGLVIAVSALRLLESAEREAKTSGVHSTFPSFVRLAYLWAVAAGFLSIWASLTPTASGIWGASRHALTVGYVAAMVFAIGQRILPAFCGMRLLFSTKLMFLALASLTVGCALRVSAEILSYQNIAPTAWEWLPVSAVLEMTAVTLFAINLLITFMKSRPATTLSAS